MNKLKPATPVTHHGGCQWQIGPRRLTDGSRFEGDIRSQLGIHANLTSGSKEKSVRTGSGQHFLHVSPEQS